MRSPCPGPLTLEELIHASVNILDTGVAVNAEAHYGLFTQKPVVGDRVPIGVVGMFAKSRYP